MVLNTNGIEPTFLKIGFAVAGGGLYSYYNHQCIKLYKEKRIQEKKSVLCLQKTFNAVLKNGFNPVLGSILRLPNKSYWRSNGPSRF